MNPQRWQAIDDLFQQALERAPGERSEFVRHRSHDDSELAREVLSLLEAERREDAFIDRPAHGGVSGLMELDAESDDGLVDLAGRRLGAYRLKSLIATGGMGAVYLAERDDDEFHKQVAIKLVRRTGTGSSTAWRDDLERRFQLERQVLARLEHPNIARLLDGGTTDDGRPYFVMEHVDGEPIDAYCDDQMLSVRRRVELFLRVCDAVQHAHQNLVIHRDLKPGNILVTHDGAPKLLDFGLAKLLDPHQEPLAGGATVTGAFMGTFAYAAPEQVHGRGGHDTRSDVYALGLVLYRLLAGRHAHSLEGGVSDVLRTITETAPPPPSRFRHAVGDELDTIVLKCLAKEPRRRYESVGSLAADLRRHLDGEPVLAKSDSRLYVLRKTVQRYRIPLAAAAAGLTLLAAFAAVVGVQSRQLARRGTELTAALRRSNIERGRLLGFSGNVAMAEEPIWREHLAVGRPPGLGRGAPGDRLSHWALWELYARYPCVRSFRHGSSTFAHMTPVLDGEAVLLTSFRAAGPGIIDARNGRVRSILDIGERHHGVSHDGATIVTTDSTSRIDVWDAATGELRRRLEPADLGLVRQLAVAPDGATVACAGPGRIVLRGLDDGAAVITIDTEDRVVVAVAFAFEGRCVLGMSAEGLRMWDATNGALLASWDGPSRTPGFLAVSADSRYAAHGDVGTTVAIRDLVRHETVAMLEGARGFITSLVFHPTLPLLAVGSQDRTVRLWEIPSGKLVATYAGHVAPYVVAGFTPDGRHLISAGHDGLIRFWELAPWRCVTGWEQSSTVFNARFAPDGRTVAACYGDGVHLVHLVDAANGRILEVFQGHEQTVASIAFSPDGLVVASASYDGTVRFWSTEGEGAQVVTAGGNANALAFSPDGSRVVVVRDDSEVQVIDRRAGTVQQRLSVQADRIPSVDWSPDGRTIALAAWPEERIVLVDLVTGTQRVLQGHERRPRIVRFNPDGSWLASSGDDGVIWLWPVDGGTPRALTGHLQGIFALDFSPDGSMLASAGRSGRIKLWDVTTQQTLVTLPGHDDIVFAVDFSPDGTRLISGSRDRTIARWDLTYYDRHVAGNARVFEGR